jgi:hypothetical protein
MFMVQPQMTVKQCYELDRLFLNLINSLSVLDQSNSSSALKLTYEHLSNVINV